MFCKNCGKEIDEGMEYCAGCAAQAESEPAEEQAVPPAGALPNADFSQTLAREEEPTKGTEEAFPVFPEMEAAPERTPAAKRPKKEETLRPAMGMWKYFFLLLLFAVPGVGLLFSIAWGFLFTRDRSLRNLSRAALIWQAIGLLIGGLLVASYFIFREQLAIGNFLERLLQYLLDFVRANADKF